MSDKPKRIVTTGPFKDIAILGHRSVEERDEEAGKVGSTLEDADYSDIYRGTLQEIHDKAAPQIASLTGISRGVNEEQTAKNQARLKEGKVAKPVPESFVDYAARVKAGISDEDWKAVDALVREIALATPVDASPSKRVGAVSKANLEKADDVLTRSVDKIEDAVSKLMADVPEFDLTRDEDGKPERSSLARLIASAIAARMASV
jgi:hypothetical protein